MGTPVPPTPGASSQPPTPQPGAPSQAPTPPGQLPFQQQGQVPMPPGQPGMPPQVGPYGYPQAAPPKKKPSGCGITAIVLACVLGGIVLIGLIAIVMGGSAARRDANRERAEPASTQAGATGPASTQAGATETTADTGPSELNTPKRDGSFEFVVTAVNCGQTEVGENEFMREKAQGVFCIVDLSIKNIGRKAQGYFPQNQKLLDQQGREFDASTSATFALTPDASTVFADINPGNTVQGHVVFDVPPDVTPKKLELHDSAFSNGVVVRL